jgi:hypothetical protein
VLLPDSFTIEDHKGIDVKVYHSAFEPPDDNIKTQTIHFDDCSGQLAIHDYYELADNEFLKFHNLEIDEYNGFITYINQRIGSLHK